MEPVYYNDFGGVQDHQHEVGRGARMVTNFDITTSNRRLVPYRTSVDGDSSSSTSQKRNFCIAYWTPSPAGYRLFALGRQSATNKAEILMKTISTGASDDFDDATWASPNGNQSGAAGTGFSDNVFVYYQKTGKIYGASQGTKWWAFTPDGSTAWDDDIITTNSGTPPAYTNTAQAFVHSKDDICYFFYDNKVMKNNNATWTTAALTLPSHLYITSACEYGNFIAIACAPLSGLGNSVVFLWDRDSTLATLSESINWGSGIIKVLEEVDGYLVGISVNNNDTTSFKGNVIFRVYAGSGGARKIRQLTAESVSIKPQLPIAKQKVDQRIYFMMSIFKNGSTREGVWSIGLVNGEWLIAHERTPNNDTALSTSATLKNFFIVGEYFFIAYQDTDFFLKKTSDQASYSTTAIYETKVNPGLPDEYKGRLLRLVSVGINHEALGGTPSIIVKHRIEGGTFKTVLTSSTVGAVYFEPTGCYADGTGFAGPTKGHEFRIESTGTTSPSIPTGLVCKYELMDSN